MSKVERLRALRDAVFRGKLKGLQSLELYRLLGEILDGRDVRKEYRIPASATRGRQPSSEIRGLHFWIACWFVRLRAERPNELEKKQIGSISDLTGLSSSRIREIVRAQKEATTLFAVAPMTSKYCRLCVRAEVRDARRRTQEARPKQPKAVTANSRIRQH